MGNADEKSLLKDIGLTDSETKVYLSLLKLGDCTRGKLVAESKIAGSKIYDNLERLQEKGLIATYLQNGVKHFKPVNPSQIISYLDQKKKDFEEIQARATTQLPMLMALFDQTKEEQEVELLTGLDGLQIIFKEQVELLEKNDICYVIGGTRGSNEEAVVAFFEKIHVMREDLGIKTKMLFNESQKDSTLSHYSTKRYPGTQTKFISHASPVAINIYADYTVIIIFGQKISAIRIKSTDVAASFKEYFDLLWNSA